MHLKMPVSSVCAKCSTCFVGIALRNESPDLAPLRVTYLKL